MKDTVLHTRVDSKDKARAEKILKNIGLDLSTAIDIYLKKIIEVKGIPFSMNKENTMIENIKATMAMEDLNLSQEEIDNLNEFIKLSKAEREKDIKNTVDKLKQGG